ncbi:MAG TPA: hypothetical protein VER32_08860, partial [Pyrinomonadaceae bacterium]|nr:hypothetical protein [Pyrinomonadaceae bacterium]
DVETVRKHLAALQSRRDGVDDDDAAADALAAYTLLGRHSIRLARQNGADARALARVARLLRGAKAKS